MSIVPASFEVGSGCSNRNLVLVQCHVPFSSGKLPRRPSSALVPKRWRC